MAKYIEEGTNYSYIVKRMKDVNFRSLRNVSVDFTKRLPEDLSSELYKDIQHGVCQLQSEPELNMYIHALGMMHEAKLQHAFEHLAIDFFSHSSIDIIDYGCGQAIGTICYADFLREKGYSQKVRKVTLIEPSELALKRAALHVSCFFPNAEIITILKGFDDLVVDDINVDEDIPTLHIFSNVIDLADDCFDLEQFVRLINNSSVGENQYLCIEPYFNYDEEDDKLQRFIELFDAEVYYRKVFGKGEFVEGREWTCNVAIGCRINKTTLCKPQESSFDLKIKQLVNNGAKLIKNVKLKNVTYSDNDGKIIVKFVLVEPIRDYVLCEDGVNYKIGKTDTIYLSIYVFLETLLANGGFRGLVSILEKCPVRVLNKIFKDATIDIVQQEVFKGEEYINPFLENYKQNIIILDRNFIVNHCVKFNLSEKGKKIDDKIVDVIFGHTIENIITNEHVELLMDFADDAKNKGCYKVAFSNYKLAANEGYAEAQYCLGNCFYYGRGVEKNEVEAVKWYKKAAEQGHASAQCNLGYCYDKGRGVIEDKIEAVEWYKKAAEQGNASAQINLGVCYKHGKGIVKDEQEAVKWYRKAADQGDADAQFELASCYKEGKGVFKDDNEAIKWYIKAAEQGNGSANMSLISDMNREIERIVRLKNLGDYYSDVDKDKLNWCLKVAKQGYLKAQVCLGWYYDVKFNYSEAVKWYTLAMKQGDLSAYNKLVFYYEYGNSGVEKNIYEAIRLCREAAKKGSIEAQDKLAKFYKEGKGVVKNYDEAINWYTKAAKQKGRKLSEVLLNCYKYDSNSIDWIIKVAEKDEYVEVQYHLARMYEQGYRVEKSYEEAVKWYKKAIENNSIEALISLALLYERGNGVNQSYEEAAKLYSSAANLGNYEAKCNLAKLYALGKGVERSKDEVLRLLDGYVDREKELYLIGLIFYEGVEVEKSYEEAINWWNLAVEKGCIGAEYMLGICFEKGQGVEFSYVEALKWYLKVAENKYATDAHNKVGFFYENGLGVEQSYEEAIKWYRKAINVGNKNAMFNLATCYRYGRGVERSYSNAVKWYKESNTEEAQQALKEISDINNPIVALFKRIKFNLGKLQ